MALTDDQNEHEPVGDSAYDTLGTPGDSASTSTLHEPYSEVSDIDEPGTIMHPTSLGY